MAKDKIEKTYTIGGTSFYEGRNTFRFANGKLNVRRNMLKFQGHERIKLVDLPRPMTKVKATAYLLEQGFKGVVPTRAANKKAKSPILLTAKVMAEKSIARKVAKASQAAAA